MSVLIYDVADFFDCIHYIPDEITYYDEFENIEETIYFDENIYQQYDEFIEEMGDYQLKSFDIRDMGKTIDLVVERVD